MPPCTPAEITPTFKAIKISIKRMLRHELNDTSQSDRFSMPKRSAIDERKNAIIQPATIA